MQATASFWSIVDRRASLLTFAVCTLVHLNSIPGDLVFDDLPAIKENPDVRLRSTWRDIFSHDFWGNQLSDPTSHKSYRPLTVLTFRFNYVLHGLQPYGYHLFNIAIHSTVATLYMHLCRHVASRRIALVAALLFAVHPIHTEAVSSIVGRSEPLSALFYSLAILAFFRSHPLPVLQRHSGSISVMGLIATSLMAGLSMLSKEQGITCLAICCVYDVVLLSRLNVAQVFQSGAITGVWKSARRNKTLKACISRCVLLMMTTGLLLIARVWMIAGGAATAFTQSDNPTLFEPELLTRTLTYFYLPAFSAWLLLCPIWLCFDWSMDSIPRLHSFDDLRNIGTILLLLLVLMLVAYSVPYWPAVTQNDQTDGKADKEDTSGKRDGTASTPGTSAEMRYKHAVVIALALLVLPYLPASNLFFPVGFVIAERILYLPSMGFSLLVAIGYCKMLSYSKAAKSCQEEDNSSSGMASKDTGKGTIIRCLLHCGLIAVIVSMTCKTLHRNTQWYDMAVLGKAGVKVNPANAKIHFSIGNDLAQQGQRACELHFREAIRLRPNYTSAWTNLGLVILNMDRAKEAEAAYRKALSINPESGNAHTNYGHLCKMQFRWSEALDHYEKALIKQPGNPTLLHNSGICCKELKNYTGAVEYWNMCVKLYPTYSDSWLAMGDVLSKNRSRTGSELTWSKGKRAKRAEEALRSGLKYTPTSVDPWLSLTQLLLTNGKIQEAEVAARTAISHLPQNSALRYWLGRVMEIRKLFPEAKKHYTAAVQLDPDNKRASSALAVINEQKTF
ncbi:protein O-mannosyl-transferase TMTC4-like [Sycon ciliatum]|uniref:protein O-mannosyl-transferase TMTC4-like n=1 Tax=Sycon ciliatum TaxID=27933 RepID=UPI0031F65F46